MGKEAKTDGMKYEVAGDMKPSKGSARRYVEKENDNLNVFWIVWYLIKRCRLGISVGLNFYLVYLLVGKFFNQ